MAKVYSTDAGRLCPGCEQPTDACMCQQQRARNKGDGVVRIRRETKGRKGAGVTLIEGLNLSDNELKKIAKQLKAHCSSGGAIKNGIVEIQGDQREKVKNWLDSEGVKTKLAGG